MFLQRLILDDTVGFNYDYMGSAEYEFGATRVGREAIAQAFLDKQIEARPIQFIELHGKHEGKPVEVIAIGKAEALDELGEEARISVTKETFRTSSENIVAWMNVGQGDVEPLLMIRANCPDIQNRVNKFIADPVAFLKEQANG